MQHQDHLSRPGILRAPKSPPGIWSSLPASPHLLLLSPFAHLSSFAHWAQVTHILSFPQTPNFSLWAWRTPEFFASSGHISNVSSSERCYRISPTHNALYFIPIFSFSNLSKKKVFKSRNWFYSFGSHNPSLDHKMGSRRRVWYLDSNSCFCSKGAVWLGARFHLYIAGLNSETLNYPHSASCLLWYDFASPLSSSAYIYYSKKFFPGRENNFIVHSKNLPERSINSSTENTSWLFIPLDPSNCLPQSPCLIVSTNSKLSYHDSIQS